MRKALKTVLCVALVLALAVVIALSRLYLYAHWPTDILGGILVGALAGWLGAKLVQRVTEKRG